MQLSESTKALGIFLITAVAIRLLSFFPSVIDHDESTYLVIADALSKGYTYQIDYIDTKPIGIFLILAAFKSVLGNTIWAYRLVAALVLGCTAFLLYRAKRVQGSSWSAGLASGVIYLALNSLYTHYGVSPNTETYFNLFTAAALLLFFRFQSFAAYFMVGLLLGIGFVIKYVVLFDGLAFGGFLVVQALRREGNVVMALSRALTMAFAAAIPFSLVIGYYYYIGEFDRFWFNSITVAGRYPSSQEITHYIVFFFQFFLRFLPVTVLFGVALWHKKVVPSVRQFGLIWSAVVLAAVLIPGNAFGHYYIQFMLPFSYLAGEFFGLSLREVPRWLRWMRNPKIGYTLLGLLFIVHLFLQNKDYLTRPDNISHTAEYLNEHLEPGDRIYTQEDQALYFLTGRLPLIPYVHPSLFWADKHISAMEIDVAEEVAKIKTARPRFMVFRHPVDTARFAAYRTAHYEQIANINDYVVIFERKD